MVLKGRQQPRLLLLLVLVLRVVVELWEELVVLYLNGVGEVGEGSRSWFSDETLTYRRVHEHNGIGGGTSTRGLGG